MSVGSLRHAPGFIGAKPRVASLDVAANAASAGGRGREQLELDASFTACTNNTVCRCAMAGGC